MNLQDVVPVFQLVFFYVLPAMLLLVFFALLYKQIKKLVTRWKEYKAKNPVTRAVSSLVDYSKMFSDFFVDTLFIFVIILPIIMMILEFMQQNSLYALQHFWDYTYPALFLIVFLTAAKVWVNVIYRIKEVFFK